MYLFCLKFLKQRESNRECWLSIDGLYFFICHSIYKCISNVCPVFARQPGLENFLLLQFWLLKEKACQVEQTPRKRKARFVLKTNERLTNVFNDIRNPKRIILRRKE